jgi:hypothetical protein
LLRGPCSEVDEVESLRDSGAAWAPQVACWCELAYLGDTGSPVVGKAGIHFVKEDNMTVAERG